MGASFCTSRRPAAAPGERAVPMPDDGNDGNDGGGDAAQGEGAGSEPAPSSPPAEVVPAPVPMLRVLGLSGDPLLEVEAQDDWTIGYIKQQVVEAQRVRCHPWQLKLQLGDQPLQDDNVLGDLEKKDLTAVVVKESVAGVYAAFTCSILVLHENGRVAYGWYDDYWSSPIRESCGSIPTSFIVESERTTGDWKVEGMTLKMTAEEEDMGDSLRIEATVANSAEALKEGISEMILVAKLWHHFSDSKEKSEPEEKTFYKIHEWPDES
eukprot:s826_g21.t1